MRFSVYGDAAEPSLRFLKGCWQALQQGYSSQWELPEHMPAPATTTQMPGFMGHDPEEDVQQRFVETFDTLLRASTSGRMSRLLQTMSKPVMAWECHGGELLACVAVVGRELGRCAGAMAARCDLCCWQRGAHCVVLCVPGPDCCWSQVGPCLLRRRRPRSTARPCRCDMLGLLGLISSMQGIAAPT